MATQPLNIDTIAGETDPRGVRRRLRRVRRHRPRRDDPV